MLDLTQLLRIPRVDAGFDISPDGSQIAFAWNKTGDWHIYELELSRADIVPLGQQSDTVVKAQGEDEIKQITCVPGGKLNPHYSPNANHIAYALDFNGSESYHLFVYNRLTGEHTDLTPNISYALQPNFCWSPDGRQLAFLSDQHGHFSAYVIPAMGGEPQLVLDVGHPAWQVEWSPDGKHLAVCCELHGQDYGIFIIALETKEVTPLCHPEQQHRVSTMEDGILRSAQIDMLNAHDPKWLRDGKELAFHSDTHGWFDVGIYKLKSKELTWVTNNEGDSQSPIFISSNRIAYTLSKGTINWIEIIAEDGKRKKYQVGQGIHNGIKFTPDQKRMVTTFSSPSQPPDLWMMDVESGEAIQLTHSMPEGISRSEFVLPEEIEYPGMDGVPVPALLFRPVKTPAPTVVMIHGGPNWHYAMEWNPVMAHFAGRGYAVLAPNYRGSTGYGREWQYAARFDLGGVDTRDVAAGAQYLIREGIADPKHIAVTGRSHGGYLTMTCLTQFPEMWCGGSAVVPFMNWFKSHDESREDLQHWAIENMGDPKENYERWYNASPYYFLDRINASVQLICGGNDPRCPASDSVDARDKLVELGKQVELLLYEEEGHSFLKIENVIDAEVRRVEFLEKMLEH